MKSKPPISHFQLLAALALCCQMALAGDYRLTTLETAHGLFRSATNAAMYAEAAAHYEYLTEQEGIRNGHLYYTLGNSWFMAGDVGRTILNYRRAEQYLPNDPDLQHNLAAALRMRSDLIPEKEPPPLVAKLLGWHLNTSAARRGWLFACCWMLFWGAWFWMGRSPKKEARITAVATGLLSALLLASLLTGAFMVRRNRPGIVLAKEVMARKGDGERYAPAFLEPLHAGTEFQSLEVRGSWRHIRLADGQTCWIPSNAGEEI